MFIPVFGAASHGSIGMIRCAYEAEINININRAKGTLKFPKRVPK